MSKSNINDYVLEIGWDGKKVNAGITDLEKRINKLAAATEKLNKATDPTKRKRQYNPRNRKGGGGGGLLGQDIIEDRKLTMLKQAEDRARSLRKTIMNLDMGAKGAKGARSELESSIVKVEAYKDALRGMNIKSRTQLREQKAAWISLSGSIEDSRLEILKANRTLGFLKSTVRGAAKSFGTAAVAAVGAYAVIGGVRALYESGKAWENLSIQMQASFGSAEAGAERMEFLIGKAQLLGVDVNALADGYAKIGVAGRMGNVPLKDSENIFLAAAESSRAFGLSMDDTQGVMRAFSQMMGKGQVMMEELKLQLGDRMPSAMGIFAKSMGMTMQQFMETVKAGKVGNKELANFAVYLRKDIRESGAYQRSLKSVEAAQTRFNTALGFAGTSFFEGQLSTAVSELFEVFTSFFNDTREFWGFLGDILGFVLNAGVYALKYILNPIAKVLKTVGTMWEWISETALTKDSDVKNLNYFQRVLRVIYLGWISILNIIDKAFFEASKFMDLISGGTGGYIGRNEKGEFGVHQNTDHQDKRNKFMASVSMAKRSLYGASVDSDLNFSYGKENQDKMIAGVAKTYGIAVDQVTILFDKNTPTAKVNAIIEEAIGKEAALAGQLPPAQ